MILKTTEFCLQLDESTLPDKKSLLFAYVRFVKDEMEEFLFVKELKAHTTGESVFQLVVGFFTFTHKTFSMRKKSHSLILYLVQLMEHHLCWVVIENLSNIGRRQCLAC